MDPTRSTPIALAERRLAWLDARQKVLAQNVANADTPGYRPRDLRSFAQLLASRAAGVALARTDARHVGPAGGSDPRAVAERRPSDLSVSGNAVSLDEQAVKVAETDTAHALAMGLHRRYLGLFRAALGRM
ncbi:flagellar basal body rod protein FlgB [Crenalkalicoccus roseus]|uniref:flagellar basal body rod protein FlgB n=1 Tax=Crenalkalicoccus roseus TaxID=1485588 RepID=UPI0010806A67|nr:flagellar basal body protein [Crenalkalicoccus roseus]